MRQIASEPVGSVSNMASLSLLLLAAALVHAAQCLPAALGGGRGLDGSVGGPRRQRRELHTALPYEDQLSYPASHGRTGVNDLYYQSDDWRGQGLEQALQRLVERDQRREIEEEQQRAAYMTALLRLLSEAERAGLVGPGDMEVVEEEVDDQEEDDQEPPADFQRPIPADYDETGRGLSAGRPSATWWGRLEPQLAQALLDRMEPQLAQALLERARQEKPQPSGRHLSGLTLGRDQEALRHLVSKVLASMGPNSPGAVSSARRMRRDAPSVSSAHRRTRRSLDDVAPPSASIDPPLLRVKRLEEEEEEVEVGKGLSPAAGLQRVKRVDEDLGQGSRGRRRRAVVTYDPQVLVRQVMEYMRE